MDTRRISTPGYEASTIQALSYVNVYMYIVSMFVGGALLWWVSLPLVLQPQSEWLDLVIMLEM